MEKVRQPIQERSIEKKNRIIQAAFEEFSSSGYYNTTTAAIAKRAEVSTGIVYGYFKDKKDILRYVLQIYADKVTKPVLDVINGLNNGSNLTQSVENIMDITMRIHKDNAHLHNILHSLAVTDKDVNAEFIAIEDLITRAASEQIKKCGIKLVATEEKVHLSMNLIQSFVHESVYDRHDYINYDIMKKDVCNIVYSLLSDNN